MDFHRECTRVFLSEYFRGNANICQGYILLGNVEKRDESSCLKSIFSVCFIVCDIKWKGKGLRIIKGELGEKIFNA